MSVPNCNRFIILFLLRASWVPNAKGTWSPLSRAHTCYKFFYFLQAHRFISMFSTDFRILCFCSSPLVRRVRKAFHSSEECSRTFTWTKMCALRVQKCHDHNPPAFLNWNPNAVFIRTNDDNKMLYNDVIPQNEFIPSVSIEIDITGKFVILVEVGEPFIHLRFIRSPIAINSIIIIISVYTGTMTLKRLPQTQVGRWSIWHICVQYSIHLLQSTCYFCPFIAAMCCVLHSTPLNSAAAKWHKAPEERDIRQKWARYAIVVVFTILLWSVHSRTALELALTCVCISRNPSNQNRNAFSFNEIYTYRNISHLLGCLTFLHYLLFSSRQIYTH